MKRYYSKVLWLFFAITVSAGIAYCDTHRAVQAIDINGYGTHPDLFTLNKVTVEGILLNRPDYMLDSTPDQSSAGLGGQWQICIQGDMNDHAGTFVWMGQCYNNVGGSEDPYTDPNWTYEIYRLSHGPNTGLEIQPGDKIRVTGLLKARIGKTNITERHSINPDWDITINLIEPDVGLPQPEVVTLSQLKDASDNFIFDHNRNFGCEYYQARLIRVNNVSFTDANWGPNKTATIQDSTGRTFPVKYGRGHGFSEYSNPTGQFDVIGILDQESYSTIWNDGYYIWVMNYDGNGIVLTDFGLDKNQLIGDLNGDGKVNFADFAELASHWLLERPEGT